MTRETDRERASTPEDIPRLFMTFVQAGDFAGVASLYEDDDHCGSRTAAGRYLVALGHRPAKRQRLALAAARAPFRANHHSVRVATMRSSSLNASHRIVLPLHELAPALAGTSTTSNSSVPTS